MSNPVMTNGLFDQLFADSSAGVFAILGGASVPNLPRVLWEQKPDRVCLIKGELSFEEQAVAPWLVKLEPGSATTDWILGDLRRRAARGRFPRRP